MATFMVFRLVNVGGAGVGPPYGFYSTRSGPAGSFNGTRGWVPKATTVDQGSISVQTAPGIGNSYTARMNVNDAGTGSTVTLTGAATTVRSALTASLPINDATGTVATDNSFSGNALVGAAQQDVNFGASYVVSFPDSNVCWLAGGDEANNIGTGTGTNLFLGLEMQGVAAVSSNETTVVVPFPLAAPGTLKYFLVRYTLQAGFTVSFSLRVNSADAITLTLPAAAGGGLVSDLVTTVPVSQSQPIGFRWNKTAGVGTGTFSAFAIIGFTG
jgi:hypothetical protein